MYYIIYKNQPSNQLAREIINKDACLEFIIENQKDIEVILGMFDLNRICSEDSNTVIRKIETGDSANYLSNICYIPLNFNLDKFDFRLNNWVLKSATPTQFKQPSVNHVELEVIDPYGNIVLYQFRTRTNYADNEARKIINGFKHISSYNSIDDVLEL